MVNRKAPGADLTRAQQRVRDIFKPVAAPPTSAELDRQARDDNRERFEGAKIGARRQDEARVNRFERWLRKFVAPKGLSDVAIASIAGALTWSITIFLKNLAALFN